MQPPRINRRSLKVRSLQRVSQKIDINCHFTDNELIKTIEKGVGTKCFSKNFY